MLKFVLCVFALCISIPAPVLADSVSDWGIDFADAITNIGSTKVTLVIDSDEIIDDGITVSVPDNIALDFTRSGRIKGVPGGGTETLSINGQIMAGSWEIFGDDIVLSGVPKVNKFNVCWLGVIGDGLTDNTSKYQIIINLAQNKVFRDIYFPTGDYVFLRAVGRTTCIFLSSDSETFTRNPNHIKISGDGRIVIDNDGTNIVWMSGPPNDEVGVTSVNDVHVSGLSFISKSIYDNPSLRVTYDDPNTTMPYYGIVFNVSKWFRSSFSGMHFEFVQGFMQDPAALDSSGTYVQQLVLRDNVSTHHQAPADSGGFIQASQTYALSILNNIIERGNGAIDLQRSTGTSSHQLKIDGNTIQGNGAMIPVKVNFGLAFTFTNNYLESNRTAAGVAAKQVYMGAVANTINSIVFEGNFFSQSPTNLDGFGTTYYHVWLDGMDDFFPKGNAYTGGNAYRMTNSTGMIHALNEKLLPMGSTYPEGAISTGLESINGLSKSDTWAPYLSDAISGGSDSPTAAINARYVCDGKVCTVSGQFVNIDTTGMNPGNTLYIKGLPVTPRAGTKIAGNCILEAITFTDMVSPIVSAGDDHMQLRQSTSGGNDLSLTVGDLNSGYADIIFSVTYFR